MRTKSVLAFIIVLALSTGVFMMLGNRDVPITNYPSSKTGIVAFGDSLFAGVGATPGNSLPEQIGRLIEEPIINLGVSGDTTADGLARIDEVLSREPKIVLISLGGNDIIRNVPKEAFYTNLEQIISRLQAEGAIVVLLGVRGPLKNYNAEYEQLSKDYGTGLVPDILDGLVGRTQYMHDTIHPNDIGYAIIANRVVPVVSALTD